MVEEELLKEWQHRLGLDDWAMSLVTDLKADEMTISDTDGCASWTECNKSARIEILAESEYGERIRPYDFERILVHELLHLKTSLVSSNVDDLQERYMHQLIDDLARAFVDAKRHSL